MTQTRTKRPNHPSGTVYKADTSDTTDFNFDANIELKKRISSSRRVTKSPQSPTNSFSQTDLDTSELRLGFSGDFRDDYSYTLNYSLWGSANQITTNTFSLEGSVGSATIGLPQSEPAYRLSFRCRSSTIRRYKNKREKRRHPVSSFLTPASRRRPTTSALIHGISNLPRDITTTVALSETVLFDATFAKFFSSSALNASSQFNEAEFIAEVGYGFKILSLASRV